MRVFKFGGASVKSADALKNVHHVLTLFAQDRLLIVVSAMGKTTNELEKIIETWYKNDASQCRRHCEAVAAYHLDIINGLDLNADQKSDLVASTQVWLDMLGALVAQPPVASYNLHYDQIICFGELLATHIISHYLNFLGYKNTWIDARNYLITNHNHRNASINWQATQKALEPVAAQLRTQNVVTQGFIARANDSTLTTTLGREGSDFTASILAHCLQATQVTIWKDVAGVLNADPKLFAFAQKINELSYQEAISLTYYGASVIHPKTVHPLQIKNIPLEVRSFLEPTKLGTLIHEQAPAQLHIPCIILKKDQILLYFHSNDLAFIEEAQLATIYAHLQKYSIRAHLTQNTARYFAICTDNDGFKIQPFIADLHQIFDIKTTTNLHLLNIRHFQPQIIAELTANQNILMEHRSRTTAQFVLAQQTF